MAIEHLVFMTGKRDSTADQAERILRSAKQELRMLPGVLDVRIAVRRGEMEVSQGSYGLFVRFVDSNCLAAYLPHPVHVSIGQQLRQHFTDFVVHDFADLA